MARMTGGSAPSAPGSRNPTQTLSHGRKSPPSPPAWILLRNFFPNNTPPPPHPTEAIPGLWGRARVLLTPALHRSCKYRPLLPSPLP